MSQYGGQKRYAGVDLTQASKSLAGVKTMSLDVDWLAVDASGCFAIVLGNESASYRLPAGADAISTSRLLEVIRASFDGRAAAAHAPAYRSAARSDAGEPIFDLPRTAEHEALHEPRFSGYPHLFVATERGAPAIRDSMLEYGGREVASRGTFAASIEIGAFAYDVLHETGACDGCRVLDLPNDPRPRSPEMLATLGFFVYGYAREACLRIASPSIAADVYDLRALGASRMECASFNGRFDERTSLKV